MAILTTILAAADAVIPFVDFAEGAFERRHELKLKKHEVKLREMDQGEVIRRGPLDEITFGIFFYPWIALWVPYQPVNDHAMEALKRLSEAPEIMVWPALLIVAKIWGVSVASIPKVLWKR